MSFNDFWNTSNRANDFLRTGKINDTVRNSSSSSNSFSPNVGSGGSGPRPTQCTSSATCPSGYACVNGACVQMNGGSGSGGGQQNSGGNGSGCNPDDPQSPCNTGGPGSCSQTPNCGDESDGRDCCGTRCCSFGSASSARPGVHCFCGECPPFPGCNSFCENYLKANGVVGPGCTEGRDGSSCDSCTVCESGQCVADDFDPPCWCSQGDKCAEGSCQSCDTDSESFSYGECVYVEEGCQKCASITNYLCPCGIPFKGQPVLGKITKCLPASDPRAPINLAQEEARRQCQALCEQGGNQDKCAPQCTTTTGPSRCTAPAKQVGVITVGDATEYLCETCKLPDGCEECDCNCNNDCGNCEICGPDGTCQPDPLCDPITDGVLIGTYPEGGSEAVFGSCTQQVYVEEWNVTETGPCCPDANNGSCGCPGEVYGVGCNIYYACLPQGPAQEGDVVQVYASFAPQPCYVYTQGAWWSSGRDCVGCPCNDKPSQGYTITAQGSDGSVINNGNPYTISRPVGYTLEVVSCSDL